ncbi:MAG: hypothetical protein VX835_03280 [Pseudomonadota bacterium]|nr:hypothetical protein [Pseudomonadota bacterium]
MILEKVASFWINSITPQMDLTALDDKMVALRIDTPNLEQLLYFHGQRIEIESMPIREPDVIITGDIYTILQFLGGNDRAKVTIEGDLSLAVAIQQLIQTANIDCQEWLSQATSRFIPDPILAFNPFSQNNQSLIDRINALEDRISQLEQKNKS